MIVRRNSELVRIETPGGNHSSAIATPRHGATETSVIHQHVLPGGHNPPHYHDREELMFVLSGSVTVTVAEQPVPLAAGDTLLVPAHSIHHIANRSAAAAEWLLIAPAGVRFFHASGEEAEPEWAR